MKNKILFDTEARSKMISGIEKVYRAVATTLGPRGNNVAVDRGHETIVLHDGFDGLFDYCILNFNSLLGCFISVVKSIACIQTCI